MCTRLRAVTSSRIGFIFAPKFVCNEAPLHFFYSLILMILSLIWKAVLMSNLATFSPIIIEDPYGMIFTMDTIYKTCLTQDLSYYMIVNT